ncbi:hypothetical protein, unknown function [Leishmania tarentolae]|uniref:Uncharacterized protein n=1 Tax=Leishmania tarentolae TaxID=5689 RepID=A0A640KPD7_LEITA|nr:hypothetical protein, unknown function [Leishmania tarentolae]
MEAETLLRLTVLSFDAPSSQSAHAQLHRENEALRAPDVSISQDIRMTFINLWAKGLGKFTSINAFLRDTFLFFLPGHWCYKPCEPQNLELPKDDDIATTSFALRLEQYCTRKAVKRWPANPFTQKLDTLVAQLQPKPRYAQQSWVEWLKIVDHQLAALRALLIMMYSAVFNSFSNVNKTLISSFQRIVWEEVQTSYALAVCDLSRLIESKLITVVARAISTNIEACISNTQLQLFLSPCSTSPSEIAGHVASAVQGRLGNLASSVLPSTCFAKEFPQIAAGLASSEDGHEDLMALLRTSISSYVEKLSAVASTANIEAVSVTQSPALPSVKLATCSSSSNATSLGPVRVQGGRIEQVAQVSPYTPRSVSLEEALALITTCDADGGYTRIREDTTNMRNTEDYVRKLVAKQREEQQAVLGWITRVREREENCCGADSTSEAATPDMENVLALEKAPAAHAERVMCSSSSNSRESLLFWNRLKHKLNLDETWLMHIIEHCRFPSESPYPNVFLKDLDVRNNDRTTRLFVEEIRPLLSPKDSPTIRARSVRLFRDACTSYGKQLWEKTLEIRETLPFLPVRVKGLLLGSMYPTMRGDKQFEVLKQIFVNLFQVATATRGTAKDAVTIANAKEQLLRRAEMLAQQMNATECETGNAKRSAAQSTELLSSPTPGCQTKPSLTSTADRIILLKKGLCGSVGRYAGVLERAASLERASTSSTNDALGRPSAMNVLASLRKSKEELLVREFSPGTPVVDVYRQVCGYHGVSPNPSVVRELGGNDVDYFAALDLSSNYVGAEGLRPVLDLLQYNGEHLVSLSVCNNDLESDDVCDLCYALEGLAGKNLVHLDLSYNPFTNSAFAALKELVLSLPCIETLTLKGTLLSSVNTRELKGIAERNAVQKCLRQP